MAIKEQTWYHLIKKGHTFVWLNDFCDLMYVKKLLKISTKSGCFFFGYIYLIKIVEVVFVKV